MRHKFWFLAQLFIKPETQARGVGQTLLSKTLQQAQRNGAENLALVTLAYNTVSTGLYVRNGMYPREPLYRVVAPAAVVERNITAPEYDVAPIAPWPQPQEWIGRFPLTVMLARLRSHRMAKRRR
jgi:GNAT superfamily N-acetyltransferase